jgi:hypothetical protein
MRDPPQLVVQEREERLGRRGISEFWRNGRIRLVVLPIHAARVAKGRLGRKIRLVSWSAMCVQRDRSLNCSREDTQERQKKFFEPV